MRRVKFLRREVIHMAMMMPKVLTCEINKCAYNMDSMCHAMAINVGGSHPMCDTYMEKAQKGGVPDMIGVVGACKIDDCEFNQSLECAAEGINIRLHSDHADCRTYVHK